MSRLYANTSAIRMNTIESSHSSKNTGIFSSVMGWTGMNVMSGIDEFRPPAAAGGSALVRMMTMLRAQRATVARSQLAA